MRTTRPLRLAAAAALGASALTLVGPAGTAQARVADAGPVCLEGASYDDASAARGIDRGADHREMSDVEKAAIEARTDQLLAERATARFRTASVTTIPVHVHVMAKSNGEGSVTDQQIAAQIQHLNDTYGGSGFTFVPGVVDRYDHTPWHKGYKADEFQSLTHEGGAGDLNIWVVGFELLGFASFPWQQVANPTGDGILVNYGAFAGTADPTFANYAEGDTVVHETGHWLGLLHTFDGGCGPDGDFVEDTTPHADPTFGCPDVEAGDTIPDTCPGDSEADPVSNFMNYSYDSCLEVFTNGQFARMKEHFTVYRS